jgi:hypothetical protein
MREFVELVIPAALALCVVRFLLAASTPGGAKLPDPSKVPGMPMAGPASIASAHAALSRQRSASRPKFRT